MPLNNIMDFNISLCFICSENVNSDTHNRLYANENGSVRYVRTVTVHTYQWNGHQDRTAKDGLNGIDRYMYSSVCMADELQLHI